MAFGFLNKLKAGLKKTASVLNTPISELIRIGRKIDEAFLEELEEALILADVGPRFALEIVDDIRAKYKAKEIENAEDIVHFLKDMLAQGLSTETDMHLLRNPDGPTVLLMVGVNGTGKTTTCAKLAQFLKEQGHSVLLAAADTFRAAAGEQLDIWSERIGVDIVRHADGADPAAVVFDACEAALSRKTDFVLVDTAGRLHNKANLMGELEKIHRVAGKKIDGAPHEVLLVLDGTTGQNALSQAQTFSDGVGLTGLVLTKLDGTAKGGIVLAINRQVKLPIKFVGTGEQAADFAPFDPHAFCDALFADLETEKEASAAKTSPAPTAESSEGEESAASDDAMQAKASGVSAEVNVVPDSAAESTSSPSAEEDASAAASETAPPVSTEQAEPGELTEDATTVAESGDTEEKVEKKGWWPFSRK